MWFHQQVRIDQEHKLRLLIGQDTQIRLDREHTIAIQRASTHQRHNLFLNLCHIFVQLRMEHMKAYQQMESIQAHMEWVSYHLKGSSDHLDIQYKAPIGVPLHIKGNSKSSIYDNLRYGLKFT